MTDAFENPDSAIQMCSAVLASNKYSTNDRAYAYAYRATARFMKEGGKVKITKQAGKIEGGAVWDDLNAAIKLDPTLAMAYFIRGQVYLNSGACGLAAADYSVAITNNLPNAWMPSAYEGRGAARGLCAAFQHDDNQYQQALSDYSHAVDLKPNDADYRRQRAGLEQSLGQNDAAQADLTAAQQIDGKSQ